MVKLGIPSLDLSTLKNVKDYKDWYGYSQKLENAIRLLREKNDALEKDGDMKHLHIMKLEKDIEGLQGQLLTYAQQNKLLNEKYKDLLEKNFKTKQQDLEPIFKPIHSKTMSLVGMLKQYATSGHLSNEATERVFSPMRRGQQQIDLNAASGTDNQKKTRRRSEVGIEAKLGLKQTEQLQIVSDMQDEEEDSERAVEMLGLKDISELGPPTLEQEPPQ